MRPGEREESLCVDIFRQLVVVAKLSLRKFIVVQENVTLNIFKVARANVRS